MNPRKFLGRNKCMVNNSSTMDNPGPQWHQEPDQVRLLFLLLAGMLCWSPCLAQDEIPQGICRFSLALPEREGPVTLGIFSPKDTLVRLLYRDAPVSSLPAGLNGLIIDWDGKDDAGNPVPAGTYTARGLVHGATGISTLPQWDTDFPALQLPKGESDSWETLPIRLLSPSQIVVLAAPDALLLKRPPLHITARIQGNVVIVDVDGLPLLSKTLDRAWEIRQVELRKESDPGTAALVLHRADGYESYRLSGLNMLVPLDAGALEMPSDTFHPRREAVGAKESQP